MITAVTSATKHTSFNFTFKASIKLNIKTVSHAKINETPFLSQEVRLASITKKKLKLIIGKRDF